MQPPDDPEKPLLERLRNVPDKSLEHGVESTEGVTGSTLEPIYSTRQMRCYSVTETELKNISLINAATALFASITSVSVTFLIDLVKDAYFAEEVSETASIVLGYLVPILGVSTAAFLIATIYCFRWRGSVLKIIKEESLATP